MKKFLINFKSVVQFLVSIIASREFAFIYCVFGTIAQTAHTYYLLDGISSLDGWWKISQSILLSFFISSSLLYFTAISDNNDKSPSGKRVLNAVLLFMWLEIVINLYYYSKHIVIDTNNFDTNNLFQLAFGVLIAIIIPVTIKLYSSQIRAKEWLDMDFSNDKIISDANNVEIDRLSREIDNINNRIDSVSSVEPIENELGTNPKEYIDNIVNTVMDKKIQNIDNQVEGLFKKHSDLSIRQFQNKLETLNKK